MEVLVTGGTGFIGSHLVAELHERGHEVTALARSASEAALPEGVEPYDGDLTDYDAVEGAFEGQDAVVNLVALTPLFKPRGGEAMHERVHLGGTENALAAAAAHGVDRFVQMSSQDAEPDAPTEHLRAKGVAQRRVTDSDLDWVVFRPSVVFGDGGEFIAFTRQLTTPVVSVLPGAGARFQPIWVGDFVPMVADAVEDDAHVGHVYEVGGPEVLTLAEVTRLAYEARGSFTTVLPVPLPLAKIGLTLAGPVPLVPFGADQARSLEIDNVLDGPNDVTAFGVEESDLRTLRDYLGLAPEPEEAPARRAAG